MSEEKKEMQIKWKKTPGVKSTWQARVRAKVDGAFEVLTVKISKRGSEWITEMATEKNHRQPLPSGETLKQSKWWVEFVMLCGFGVSESGHYLVNKF